METATPPDDHRPLETNEGRFERLYQDYYSRARDLLRASYGFDVATAEDCVQAAFVNIWRTIEKIWPGEIEERRYVFTLTMREGTNVLRQRQRRGPHSPLSALERADDVIGAESLGRPVGGRVVEPMEQGVEDRELIAQAIERCHTQRQRDVLLLHLAGLSGVEIAEALEMPPATVRSHLRRHQARVQDLAALI